MFAYGCVLPPCGNCHTECIDAQFLPEKDLARHVRQSPDMQADLDYLERLRYRVIGRAIEVHRRLGPGLLESAYRDALAIELSLASFEFEKERRVAIDYRGQPVGTAFRLDIVVEHQLVVEVKSVQEIHRVHIAQVLTYLKLAEYPTGLLINFNVTVLKQGIKRLIHPDLSSAK